MMHAGLDLSRKKLEICLLSEEGEHLDQLAVAPDVDSLTTLARRIDAVHAEPVCAVVESMTGARLVHDTLEQQGWEVEIADAQKVKGLAPLACKTAAPARDHTEGSSGPPLTSPRLDRRGQARRKGRPQHGFVRHPPMLPTLSRGDSFGH